MALLSELELARIQYDTARTAGIAATQHLTGRLENMLEGLNARKVQGVIRLSDHSDSMQGQLATSNETWAHGQ